MDQVKLTKAKNIVKTQKNYIMKKYNIKNIGVGFKTEDGVITEKIAITVHVNKKDVTKIKNLPENIEGIPIDIITMDEDFKI